MNLKLIIGLCLPVVAVVLPISGCGKNGPSEEESLKFFGMTYYNYVQIYKKSPSGWDDIMSLAKEPGLEEDAAMLIAVKEAGYIVIWDAADAPDKDKLLAYLPDMKEKGGKALFFDGSARNVTAEELSALLQ